MVEETARIDKREVQTGRVKVHLVETSEQMVREALSSQNVKVTRVPVDQPVTRVPVIRTENGITIVPVLEEILVVEKRLILREELHIEQEVSHETVEVPVSLRKQRAVVERVGAQGQRITEEKRDDERTNKASIQGAQRIITAFFDNKKDASEAVERLTRLGLTRDNIKSGRGLPSRRSINREPDQHEPLQRAPWLLGITWRSLPA